MRIKIQNLSFQYKEHPAIENISFSVNNHEIIALLGPNGAGKSTLLKCINRILNYKSGQVIVGQQDIKTLSSREIAREIAYVAQYCEKNRLTVFDAVLLGRYPHINYGISEKDLLLVNGILKKLCLYDMSLRYIDELSGGELQKVSIARALVQDPDILLLDEPISSLDLKNQMEILHLVQQVVREHDVSVIMSLHDINMAIQFSHRILFLKDKKVYRICKTNEISKEIINEVYDVEVKIQYYDEYPVVIPIARH